MIALTDTNTTDLSGRSDEDLVGQCQREHGGPAAEELERRCRGLLDGLVREVGRNQRLSACDVEDARQDANLAFMEAAYGYEFCRDGQVIGCPFRAYLIRVVRHRLQDGCRGRRRAESHLERSRQAAAFMDTVSVTFAGPHSLGRGVSNDDPAMTAERHEAQTFIRGVLHRLEDPERRIADAWVAAQPLTTTAGRIGVSYDAPRTLARRVKCKLMVVFRGMN